MRQTAQMHAPPDAVGRPSKGKGRRAMDILRKTVLLGLGLITLSKEKAEGVVEDLIKRGEVASEDRYRAVDSLLKEAEKQEEELNRRMTGSVHKVMADLGIPTKKDMDEILRTLKNIEQKLSKADETKVG
jgi:polyhydroxyalkanoate synthesis regulator phasin